MKVPVQVGGDRHALRNFTFGLRAELPSVDQITVLLFDHFVLILNRSVEVPNEKEQRCAPKSLSIQCVYH